MISSLVHQHFMVGGGARKRDLLVEIRPDGMDVKIHKIMKLAYPFASSIAICATAFVFYQIYDGQVPLEMLFLLALLVPMAIFAYIFSMAISTPFAYPIMVFPEGIEFRSTWLGAKMGLPGLIPKDEIDRIELVAHEGRGKGKAVAIFLKNKKVQVVHRRNEEDLVKLARTLESSLGLKVVGL